MNDTGWRARCDDCQWKGRVYAWDRRCALDQLEAHVAEKHADPNWWVELVEVPK